MIESTFRFISVECTVAPYHGSITVDDYEVVITKPEWIGSSGHQIKVVLSRAEVMEFSIEFWTECDRQATEFYVENRADQSCRRDTIT